jgi:seryl-tRNA synthetase
MHDINWVREHPDEFERGLARRGVPKMEREKIVDDLLTLDKERRDTIVGVQKWQETRNRISREIGEAKRAGDEKRAAQLMEHMTRLKGDITTSGEQVVQKLSKKLEEMLAQIPNLPAEDVPDGKDASDNVEHHHFGAKHNFGFEPKHHFDLGETLGQMDFETAAKLSGARFVVLKHGLARLERALAQFMLDVHTNEHGYAEIAPPLLVHNDAMFGTAQLPKFAEDQFSTINKGELIEAANHFISKSIAETFERLPTIIHQIQQEAGHTIDPSHAIERAREVISADMPQYQRELLNALSELLQLWLIPTAEVPLTNLVRESILDEDALPLRFTACTPCFRAEAGAAGKDTRGMIRQHQFTKVELVSITTPEQSRDEHERMLACAEEVLRRLELPYRVVTLCAGDMGFPSQKTYDIEVWLPGQNAYREISSCSNCGEFQARRMNARYRVREQRQPRHVHTLNGSGVAVGRALIAVMENYQQQGGSIVVPDALQSYMGGLKVIEPQK